MSNKLINDMRSIRLPAVAKGVLWVLCDIAQDDGNTFGYAPLSRLIDETCYQRNAVINALTWLESVGLIFGNRSNGRKTTYKITLENANQQAIDDELNRKKIASKRVLHNSEPVDQTNQLTKQTSCSGHTQPVDQNTQPVDEKTPPVDQTNTNRIIPINPQKQPIKPREALVSKPSDVSDQVWNDFLKLRKTKKAPLTQTALDGIIREANLAGWTLEAALSECQLRGWQAFKADWVNKPTNQTTRQNQQANGNVNASFGNPVCTPPSQAELARHAKLMERIA